MCFGASRQEEYVSRSFLSHGKRLCSSSILYSQWEFYSRAHKVAVSIKILLTDRFNFLIPLLLFSYLFFMHWKYKKTAFERKFYMHHIVKDMAQLVNIKSNNLLDHAYLVSLYV